MPEAELYLAAGALLFYLFDSALLLYGDELLFATGPSGWHNVAAGGVSLVGRRVLLPNPLLPAARVMRICWSAPAVAPAASAPTERVEAEVFRIALRPLQLGVVTLLLLIAVGLPAVLYTSGQGLPLLLLLLAIYALNLLLAAWLWRARTALGLDPRACLFLTIDLLLCPPFGINVVRKIALRQPSPRDPLAFAQARFGAAQLGELRSLLLRRVQVELAAALLAGGPVQELEQLSRRLEALAS